MKLEIHPLCVIFKAICLFVIINLLYALIEPQGAHVSGYNSIFPGRTRLPFGVAGDPYSVTVENVDIMFASHTISAPKDPHEFRVVLIGDSSVWGEDLGAQEVISEQWNQLNIPCGDKIIRAYNLGYPHPSVLKDLVILEKAVEYEPDLIVWFVTLNTLISQRVNPFLMANRERVARVLNTHHVAFQQSSKLEKQSTFYERTLVGQRSNLARRVRLEILGLIWTATGEDTNRSAQSGLTDFNVSEDTRYRGMEPPQNIKDMLLFSALAAGQDIAGPAAVLIVNEPIYLVPEEKVTVRYNAVYPRWAYDQYREHIADQAEISQWNFLDLWNAVSPEYFADAYFHLSVEGERVLIQQINPALQSIGCNIN